ncbi:MAG: hypothetical protein D6737_18440 [Chloroflexi bacterium]|nr:MAG: hypothetical protein D6737_18440 [Chloroflexota bacterium]
MAATTTLRQQFIMAKQLIDERRLDEARQLLMTINHPKAQEWIRRIDLVTMRANAANANVASVSRPRRVAQPQYTIEANKKQNSATAAVWAIVGTMLSMGAVAAMVLIAIDATTGL